jgi:putative CocE/NonD family hydrolase
MSSADMSSAPAPAVRVDRDLVIPLADGTRLAADLYRPDTPEPVPVLVSCYPYRKDDIIGSLFEGTRIRLCERGYATVFADMTGTGASEGDYGESFDLAREGRYAAAVVEWVAGQDWCDGRVGAWGVSYGGMTALAAAAQRPASLRAIIAVYATTDIYRDTIAPGGCPAMLGRYAWAAHMMALGLCPPTRPDPGGRWRRTWTRRLRRLAGAPSHAVTWQAHPDRDAYWNSRVLDAAAIDVPAMLIGGWADMFKDAMTSLYTAVTGPKRLVMGPWMHVLPHLSGVEPYDWVSEMADWWDEHLGRAPTPPRDPVLFYAHGAGWRSAGQWPPEGGGTRRLFLAMHGLALAPDEPGQRDYLGDAGVGVAAGMWDPFGTGNGWPEEQSGDDARSLTFTSEPLPGPILIAGRPEAELYLFLLAGAGEAQLAARLAMVGPDGRSTLITTGWRRLEPAVAGGPVLDGAERVAITLGAAAFAVPAGARLRLSVACADFPRIWPSAENPAIRVCFGADRPSALRIPVCDRDVAPAGIPAPPAVPDPGWVSGGEPRYHVAHDKAAGEVAVTFGARSSLRPPSGTEMSLDERFTARVRPGQPAGAALTAQVDVALRLPGGERVDVAVRSTSSRTTSLTQGRVILDGALLFEHTWTNADSLRTDHSGSARLRPALRGARGRHRRGQGEHHPARLHRRGGAARPDRSARRAAGRRRSLPRAPAGARVRFLPDRLAGRVTRRGRAQHAVLVLPHPAGGTAVPDGGVRRRRGLGGGGR